MERMIRFVCASQIYVLPFYFSELFFLFGWIVRISLVVLPNLAKRVDKDRHRNIELYIKRRHKKRDIFNIIFHFFRTFFYCAALCVLCCCLWSRILRRKDQQSWMKLMYSFLSFIREERQTFLMFLFLNRWKSCEKDMTLKGWSHTKAVLSAHFSEKSLNHANSLTIALFSLL